MLIGETLATVGDATNDQYTVVYTPAFPRQGNGITSVVEAIHIPADTTLTVQPETVNSEAAESGWGNLGSVITLTSGDLKSEAGASGAMELVRYKITLSTTSSTVPQFAHFRILNPSWQTSGAQSI